MRRQPPRRRLRPSFPSSPSRSFPAIRTRPEPFFPSPLPPSRENFVFVSYSTSMIRSLRYIDFVRIAKTERLERKQGERERGRGEERDGRVAGNRFSIKRAVYPSLGWFARTV